MKDSGSCFWLIPKPPNNFSTLFYPQVTSEADVSQAIKLANEKFGPLTVAVNCAGIGIAMRTLSKKGVHPLNQFEKVLKVNFSFSPFLLSKYKDELTVFQGLHQCSFSCFIYDKTTKVRVGSLKLLPSSNLMGMGDEAQERLPGMGG